MIDELRQISNVAKKEQEKQQQQEKRLKEQAQNEKEKIHSIKQQRQQLKLEKKVERKIKRVIRKFDKRAKKAASLGNNKLKIESFTRSGYSHRECYKKPLKCKCTSQKVFIKKLQEHFEPKGFFVEVKYVYGDEPILFDPYDIYEISIIWNV